MGLKQFIFTVYTALVVPYIIIMLYNVIITTNLFKTHKKWWTKTVNRPTNNTQPET